jgi:hypothetical protein
VFAGRCRGHQAHDLEGEPHEIVKERLTIIIENPLKKRLDPQMSGLLQLPRCKRPCVLFNLVAAHLDFFDFVIEVMLCTGA